MTLLITGGAGYVGSHFLKVYLKKNPNSKAVVVDNLTCGHEQALSLSDRLSFIEGDIANSEMIERVIVEYEVDSVVHFAAKTEVGESQKNPFDYFKNNVIYSVSLFEAMEKCAVRKIVFSSTCATYGLPEYLPLDELHPQKPTNVYGMTKLMTEQELSSLAKACSWSSVSLRYFNAAGASFDGTIGESHNPETHLIPNLLKAANGSLECATIHGTDYDTRDGTCVRDYVHVDDLAMAHCLALDFLQAESNPGALALNLGSTKGWTVLELLAACEEAAGRKIPKQFGPRRPGDPPILVANSDKAEQVLGWKANYNLSQIIETAWQWEQNRLY